MAARSEQSNSLEARLERALAEGDIDAVRAINAERRSEPSYSRTGPGATGGRLPLNAATERSYNDVMKLLAAAEQIADGLAELALDIYERDQRWKDLLAAANAVSVHAQDAHREAQRLLWEKAEVE